MNNKTCELDAIPTNLIKDILSAVLKTIMQIVNMSLTTGIFPLDWKKPIIRPLIRKAGLELSKKNYRPVSNLCFLSKLVEYCILNNFSHTVITTACYQISNQYIGQIIAQKLVL